MVMVSTTCVIKEIICTPKPINHMSYPSSIIVSLMTSFATIYFYLKSAYMYVKSQCKHLNMYKQWNSRVDANHISAHTHRSSTTSSSFLRSPAMYKLYARR